ncbi:MAG: pectate lyase [Ignavibacteria bacterium]|nr:pectate lyase [Ignavibacteria bacterium]
MNKLLVHFLLFTLLIFTNTYGQTPAFPGAEGFGRFAVGGRGGAVFEVTNLNDSGPGSFREAVEAAGPRTVVFRVSGTIELKSILEILNGNITIAGQTAPGDGICLRNYTLSIKADDVIIRFIRARLGDVAKFQDDAVNGTHGKNIIVDHCSFSWSIDETASFYGKIENLTVQWCIISESLNESTHEKGAHGYGGIWGGVNSTFHHNLLSHHSSRNPRFNNGNTHRFENVDMVNNVIYNWGHNGSYGGELGQHNIRFNYYKAGPATKKNIRDRIIDPWDTTGSWYVQGNYVDGFPEVTKDNWNGGVQGKYAAFFFKKRASVPFPNAPLSIQSPQDAFNAVLINVGACIPKRDIVDARIIKETETGTAKFGKPWGGGGTGIIDSQNDVGGWPELKSLPAPIDSDHDGMPDDWEKENHLNPADARDNNLLDASGYTNLERYLNSLAVNIFN